MVVASGQHKTSIMKCKLLRPLIRPIMREKKKWYHSSHKTESYLTSNWQDKVFD